MSRKPIDLDEVLDQAIAEIRDDELDPQTEQASAKRVWERISREAERVGAEDDEHSIRDCSGFQALIPAYLQKALQPARSMLLQDHLNECVVCRRQLKQLQSGRPGSTGRAPASRKSWMSGVRWRVAAAAAVVFMLVGLSFETDLFVIRAGGLIRIESVDGELFRVTEDGNVPLKPGDQLTLEQGQNIRTAKDSAAMIRLADQSVVEMDSRSELAVYEQRALWNRGQGDSVIDLERGNIIVEASDQGSGNLLVDTEDCRAAVTGTVFAVSHGIKGSRVSVIEGSVEVAHSGFDDVLRPGEQLTTNPGLSRIPLEREIAWSRNAEQHLELMRELQDLGRELGEVLNPELRYSTTLLDLAPADTAIYIAIPNVSRSLTDAHSVLHERIGSSAVLNDWWEENMVSTGGDENLRKMIEKVSAFGDHLGDEIGVIFDLSSDGEPRPPLIAAEVSDAKGFRDLVSTEIAELKASTDFDGLGIRMLDGQPPHVVDASRTSTEDTLYFWEHEGIAVLSVDLETIQEFAPGVGQIHGQRADSPFLDRVASLYENGVQYVLAVDLENLLDRSVTGDETDPSSERASLRDMGVLDMQHLIAEHKSRDGRTEYRAVLSFSQARRGVVAWLDEPAPMGALDFISTQPALAAGFVMREPRVIVDELFGTMSKADSSFDSELAEVEREIGIDIRRDIAAPLGGEFAFALDGPMLPKPSWKLILEVYDPVQLQQTVEWVIEQANQEARASNGTELGLNLISEEVRGRTYHKLESGMSDFLELNYVFEDGYMIVAPSRVLIDRAIEYRDGGINLARSSNFTSLLPQDGEIHFSAMVYQHLGPMLGPLARTLSNMQSQVPPEQQQMIDEITEMARPSLTLAYGEEDQVSLVYSHEGGLLGSGLGTLFSFRSLMDVSQLLGQAAEESIEHSLDPSAPAPARDDAPRVKQNEA